MHCHLYYLSLSFKHWEHLLRPKRDTSTFWQQSQQDYVRGKFGGTWWNSYPDIPNVLLIVTRVSTDLCNRIKDSIGPKNSNVKNSFITLNQPRAKIWRQCSIFIRWALVHMCPVRLKFLSHCGGIIFGPICNVWHFNPAHPKNFSRFWMIVL